MFRSFGITRLLVGVFCAVIAFGIVVGCSPEHYKSEADEEVYKIINSKWQDEIGEKANYTISDVPPSQNDVQIERTVPSSGVITLAQAIAMATAHNRDYKEDYKPNP